MQTSSDQPSILAIAVELFGQTYVLDKTLREKKFAQPSFAAGSSTDLWSSHEPEIETPRNAILYLTKLLSKLLLGPHGFLHEFISSNWDCGALYTILEFDILEKIPFSEEVHVSKLAEESKIQEAKLLSILRLAACDGILKEGKNGFFAHTVVSETLVKDEGFKSFIRFQLFETRIASAHLADSLKKPNEFWTGQSAFKHAWGSSMYEWHAKHTEKGRRFGAAMESVSKSLDPGNQLLLDFLETKIPTERNLIIELRGKRGSTSVFLAEKLPHFTFEVQEESKQLLTSGEENLPASLRDRVSFKHQNTSEPQSTEALEKTYVYIVKNILWNISDDECLEILQGFVPLLEKSPETLLLVNELMSPARGTPGLIDEQPYRRRDVTLMTMHNAKQRTEVEWRVLLEGACPNFDVKFTPAFTSHSSRGLWEISWKIVN